METAFKQTKKVGVAGSFQNQLMGNNNTIPVVGEYATHLMYSDRHPYKVVEVSADKTKAKLQHIEVSVIDGKYIFNEVNAFMNIQYRKNGWVIVSNTICIDPKFIKEMEAKHNKMYGAYLLTPEQKEAIYFNQETQSMEVWPQNIIPGVTKAKKEYNKISVLFRSTPDYYYDPHF